MISTINLTWLQSSSTMTQLQPTRHDPVQVSFIHAGVGAGHVLVRGPQETACRNHQKVFRPTVRAPLARPAPSRQVEARQERMHVLKTSRQHYIARH